MSTKSRIIIGLLIAAWLIAGKIVYSHKDSVKLVNIPPQSLAKWYKPENKRHVWLHTMFNLRRDVQAIGASATAEDEKALTKWVGKFTENYNKIGEMVPEWNSRLDHELLARLQDFQSSANFSAIAGVLQEMQDNCDSCHERYRVITALLYRAPDFTDSRVEPSETLSESMLELNVLVNDIKLSLASLEPDKALPTLETLKTGIEALGSTCAQCHEHTPKNYPDEPVLNAIDELQAQLQTDDVNQQGRALGTLAVLACAQCHGTHRIAADVRQLLTKSTSFSTLLAH